MKNHSINIALFLFLVAVIFFTYLSKKQHVPNKKFTPIISKPKGFTFQTLVFNHEYKEIYAPKFVNLRLPHVIIWGVSGEVNKFIMGMQWKPITDAVEDRYNLPRGFLFAIMIQESTGVEFLGNASNDGGFGLCHMQPETASEFGLKIYESCTERVCVVHARRLKEFIRENKYDRALLAEIDERLDHIKNIDAAGRIIAFWMDRTPVDQGPLRTALSKYTGKMNYDQYWPRLKKVMNKLNDKFFMARVEHRFDKMNPYLEIDGQAADWQMYLQSYRKICENYGLSEYKLLPKYHPQNSDIVQKTYQNFLHK